MLLQRALRLALFAAAFIGNVLNPSGPAVVSAPDQSPYVPNVTCSSEATAPKFASSGNAFAFIAFGDSRGSRGSASPTAPQVARQMEQWSFDFMLHDGDFVDAGSASEYKPMLFAVFKNLMGKALFFPAIGNHEAYSGGRTTFVNNFDLPQNGPAGLKELVYSFDWDDGHFVVLNTSDDYSRGSAQYNWLQNDLTCSRAQWKFVLMHAAPYSSGSEHGSDVNLRNVLGPVFEAGGVDMVFSGHDHDYERTYPMYQGHVAGTGERGVTYVVSAGGGAPLQPVGQSTFTAYARSALHFTRITIENCSLSMQAIDADGTVFDSFASNKCNYGSHTYLPMLLRSNQ